MPGRPPRRHLRARLRRPQALDAALPLRPALASIHRLNSDVRFCHEPPFKPWRPPASPWTGPTPDRSAYLGIWHLLEQVLIEPGFHVKADCARHAAPDRAVMTGMVTSARETQPEKAHIFSRRAMGSVSVVPVRQPGRGDSRFSWEPSPVPGNPSGRGLHLCRKDQATHRRWHLSVPDECI